MQIDAHSLFVKGWDSSLVNDITRWVTDRRHDSTRKYLHVCSFRSYLLSALLAPSDIVDVRTPCNFFEREEVTMFLGTQKSSTRTIELCGSSSAAQLLQKASNSCSFI